MKKEYIENVKILCAKRERNSIYGNPKHTLTVLRENGEIVTGKTSTDALIGYEVGSSWTGSMQTLAFHFTKAGNCIFDRTTTHNSNTNLY